jgi:hypothetical protein
VVFLDNGRTLVAYETVQPFDPQEDQRTLHDCLIPSDIAKVCVDEVIPGHENAKVPLPVDDHIEVGELRSYIIGWHSYLVELCTPEQVTIEIFTNFVCISKVRGKTSYQSNN